VQFRAELAAKVLGDFREYPIDLSIEKKGKLSADNFGAAMLKGVFGDKVCNRKETAVRN
jgi:hypothetical protein